MSGKPSGVPIAERIARLTKPLDNGCVQWIGTLNHGGYGKFRVGDRNPHVHRVVYELEVGPIPEGFHIDHLCNNRACVNPEHLEAVTPAENNRRSNSPSAIHARKTHCIHGHELVGENLVPNRSGKRICRECQRARGRRYHSDRGAG